MAPDPFSARSTLSTPFGETVTYYRLEALEEQGLANLDTLPFTVRILLEKHAAPRGRRVRRLRDREGPGTLGATAGW